MNLLRSGIDTYVLYTIVKKLASPFTEWTAFKLGVIDDKGNFLIDKKNRTPEQYASLTYLDIFVMNLKKLLQKIPGANNRFVTYSAALWLLREDRYIQMDMLTEDGTPVPANNSDGGGLARSSEREAKALKIGKQVLKRMKTVSEGEVVAFRKKETTPPPGKIKFKQIHNTSSLKSKLSAVLFDRISKAKEGSKRFYVHEIYSDDKLYGYFVQSYFEKNGVEHDTVNAYDLNGDKLPVSQA